MSEYLPEGELILREENKLLTRSLRGLEECLASGKIIEAPCTVCDNSHNLIVDFGFMKGIIPHDEGAVGITDGTTRDIALISRVNKAVCFKVTGFSKENGVTTAILSRRLAQQECIENYLDCLRNGDIVKVRVTHLEQFGCFVDIGCGIPSLIPIDAISVSRITHPADRFCVGQKILAVVKCRDNGKITLTHKELLGTWEENAANFHAGETVAGIVRSIESYGIFVELAPNLAGLAEIKEGVKVNQHASVYIKAFIPEKMKIKLIIVDTVDNGYTPDGFNYFIKSGHIDRWNYSVEGADKRIETTFDP
ncbi:MAG: S1 RNA-binding domain-containing protein [Ruminiclostridium sp.]